MADMPTTFSTPGLSSRSAFAEPTGRSGSSARPGIPRSWLGALQPRCYPDGGFSPFVATKLTQSPWFLKTPKVSQPPFLHSAFVTRVRRQVQIEGRKCGW
jgi:hypothetical protein